MKALPNVADGPLRAYFNTSLAKLLTKYQTAECPSAPAPAPYPAPPMPDPPPLPDEPYLPSGLVDWSKSPLARLVYDTVGDLIGPSGLCGVNKLVEIGLPAGVMDRDGLNVTLYDNVTAGVARVQVGAQRESQADGYINSWLH